MNLEIQHIDRCKDKIFSGQRISSEDARNLINVSNESLEHLSKAANEITRKFNGNVVDVETLINAKKGNCPEDCSFCSQSAFYKSGIEPYKLLPIETIIENARRTKEAGVKSFCLVCAWRGPSESEFDQICEIIKQVNEMIGIEVNCSLGFISEQMAVRLKNLNVKRYNHNLESSKSFFTQICTTHTYQDRINTAKIVKQIGLELCCGGIIGMGESRLQRLEMGIDLAELDPEECPINILVPQKGTPLEFQKSISIHEILRTIATYRFLMPKTILKIAGGREVHLSNDQEKILLGGANGIITGGYLTIDGNMPKDDLQMIAQLGLES